MARSYDPIEVAKQRSLLAIVVTCMADGMLLFIVVKHPFLPLRILAGVGVIFSWVFIAYHVWSYRYYRRMHH